MKEFIKMMNDLQISQKSIDWIKDIPEEIYRKYFNNGRGGNLYSIVANELDVDKHRWYELSTTIVTFMLGTFGVEHISNLYSESSSCSDICHTLEFFEVEEVVTTIYKRKNED